MIDSFCAGPYRVSVLYLDNHLLAVEKPPNMPAQADESGDLDLLTACKAYLKERFQKPGAVYLGLVHRLDRPVGGVMVLARTSKAAARLTDAFRTHAVDKRYLEVLVGALAAPRRMDDYLLKDPKSGSSRVVSEDTPGAKRALLTCEPLQTVDALTLAEVTLYSGRSHQIRVQHAAAGFPLWGDARYGGGRPGEQIALWCVRLTIAHPTQKTPVSLISCPPGKTPWTAFTPALERYFHAK